MWGCLPGHPLAWEEQGGHLVWGTSLNAFTRGENLLKLSAHGVPAAQSLPAHAEHKPTPLWAGVSPLSHTNSLSHHCRLWGNQNASRAGWCLHWGNLICQRDALALHQKCFFLHAWINPKGPLLHAGVFNNEGTESWLPSLPCLLSSAGSAFPLL